MDEQLMVFGRLGELRFSMRWESDQFQGTAAERTRGELAAHVGDRLVWGLPGAEESRGFLWTWIELLEHLAEVWALLEWEQGDPLGLMEPPESLRVVAENQWRNSPREVRDRQERQVWSFEQAHDLASGVQGAWLPALWIVREGTEYVVAGQGAQLRQPAQQVLETLEGLGGAILDRVSACTDARATAASEAWKRRRQYSTNRFVSVATGLDRTILDQISLTETLEDTWELQGEVRDNELLAVARMAGPGLPPRVIRRIVQRVRRIPHHDVPALEELTRDAPPLAPGIPLYEQGHVLATWLRERLGVEREHRRMDPDQLLTGWKVKLLEFDLSTESVDAVSCWGPAHGPAILVNPSGKHSQGAAGRRATLAHEICHLLIDRGGALPLAEVLGGRVASEAEARARAFAAELLLPQHIAGESLLKTEDPRAAVLGLCRRFQVSKWIAAWQGLNSGYPLPELMKDHLESLVKEYRVY